MKDMLYLIKNYLARDWNSNISYDVSHKRYMEWQRCDEEEKIEIEFLIRRMVGVRLVEDARC